MPEPATEMLKETPVPKLRSSCDSCGASKTRCDHVRPTCGRCVEQGRNCVYGISRMAGKPPRKRPGSNLNGESLKKRLIQSESNHEDTGPGQSGGLNDHHTLQTMTKDLMLWPSGNDSLDMNEVEFSSSFTSILDEWPQLNSLNTNLGYSSAQASDNQLLISTSDPIYYSSAQNERKESHSCARESYEILRDLICPTPDLHAPESTSDIVSASLDQVLLCNKSAMVRLGRLLKCSCSKSGHRVMVHASIVSRILIWYQQAAGWTGTSSESRLSELTDSSRGKNSPQMSSKTYNTAPMNMQSLSQFTGFVVAQVPILMGSFGVDQNLQAIFRYRLILSELNKVSDLIDQFISLNSYECTAIGLADLYPHLGRWLRCEHSRTVKFLESRLGALERMASDRS
jgi:hypothetical protein